MLGGAIGSRKTKFFAGREDAADEEGRGAKRVMCTSPEGGVVASEADAQQASLLQAWEQLHRVNAIMEQLAGRGEAIAPALLEECRHWMAAYATLTARSALSEEENRRRLAP